MSATYPGGVKSFTALNNGDTIQDTDIEAAYDEITAVETALVSSGLAHNLTPDASAGLRTLGSTTKSWGLTYLKGLTLADATTLTVAAGVVTGAQALHALDTESAAASDDLDTITAGAGQSAGTLLVLRAANVARVVTLKDGTGNLLLNGDYALSATDRTITLLYDGTNWRELARSATRSMLYSVGSTISAGPAGGSTVYLGTQGHTTSESTSAHRLPVACTARNLYVRMDGDPGNTQTFVVTLRKNGSDTTVTVTITGNGTNVTTGEDTTHSATFAAGDIITVKVVTSGGATTRGVNVSMELA